MIWAKFPCDTPRKISSTIPYLFRIYTMLLQIVGARPCRHQCPCFINAVSLWNVHASSNNVRASSIQDCISVWDVGHTRYRGSAEEGEIIDKKKAIIYNLGKTKVPCGYHISWPSLSKYLPVLFQQVLKWLGRLLIHFFWNIYSKGALAEIGTPKTKREFTFTGCFF